MIRNPLSRGMTQRTGVVGTFHVTAWYFSLFAGRNLMKKPQDPRLTVPGISSA